MDRRVRPNNGTFIVPFDRRRRRFLFKYRSTFSKQMRLRGLSWFSQYADRGKPLRLFSSRASLFIPNKFRLQLKFHFWIKCSNVHANEQWKGARGGGGGSRGFEFIFYLTKKSGLVFRSEYICKLGIGICWRESFAEWVGFLNGGMSSGQIKDEWGLFLNVGVKYKVLKWVIKMLVALESKSLFYKS